MQSIARRRAARTGVLLLAAVAGLSLPPSAGAVAPARATAAGPRSWPAPETLVAQGLGTDSNPTPIALDAKGDAVAVWSETTLNGPSTTLTGLSVTRTIRGAVRPAAGTWQRSGALLGTGIDPGLALDGGGNATAVWQTDRRPFAAVAARLPAGASWLSPEEAGHAEGEGPQVASDARGDSIVVWSQSPTGNTHHRIEAAVRPAGGPFAPPQPVSLPDGAYHPRIAMDARGDALVAWEANSPAGGCIVRAAFRASGEGWEAQHTLSDSHASCGAEQRLAIGPSGQAIVLWQAQRGSTEFIDAAVRTAAGRWRGSHVLSRAQILNGAEVAMNARGEAIAAWTKVSPAGASDAIQMRSYTARQGWSTQQNIPGGNGGSLSLALDTRGDMLLAWQSNGPRIEVAARTAGARWQQPRVLSRRAPSGTPPGVSLDARGDALVSWEDDAGIETVWRRSLFP